jgi:phosphonopyruvate decarboxylase
MDFERIATGCGYKAYFCAHDQITLNKAWQSLKLLDGTIFLEIKIQIGSRANLGRPSSTPKENKSFFMTHANA